MSSGRRPSASAPAHPSGATPLGVTGRGRPRRGTEDAGPEALPPEAYPATGAEPGSAEKVRVLVERAEQGLPLWHPQDRQYSATQWTPPRAAG